MLLRLATIAAGAFLLHLGTFSFQSQATTIPEDCGRDLEATHGVMVQLRQEQILDVAGTSWAGWHLDDQGRAILGTLGSGVLAFEPLKSTQPVMTSTSSFQDAMWVDDGGQPALYASDGKGQMFRFTLGGVEAAVSLPGEPAVSVFAPPSSSALVINPGAIQVSRVRIMPVGSELPPRDLMAAGSVEQVLVQRETATGRVLAAVKSQQRLEVFDLKAAESTPISSVPLVDGASVQPQWLTDGLGQSILIYIDSGRLHADSPLTNGPVSTSYSLLSTTQTGFEALLVDGVVTVVLKGVDGHNKILRLVGGAFVESANFNSAAGEPMTLFHGDGQQALIAFVDPVSRVVNVNALAQPQLPLFSMSLRDSEKVAGFAEAGVEPGRHLLAVRTDARVYVLDLQSSNP